MDHPAAASVLCEKCRGLCENGTGWCWAQHSHGEQYPAVYVHHSSLHALKAKGAEGCALCSIILRALIDFCKLDPESFDYDSNRSRWDLQETENDIKRIVSRVKEIGVLQPPASRRDPPDNPKKRTHTFHPAFDQERFERLQSVFGRERLLIKARTLDPSKVGIKLPDSLSVFWLGSIKTCVTKGSTGPRSIRLLVDYGEAFILFHLLFFCTELIYIYMTSSAQEKVAARSSSSNHQC